MVDCELMYSGVGVTRADSRRRTLGRVLALVACTTLAAAADPPGTPASRDALALCQRAADAPKNEQLALLDRALAAAERAVAGDDRDALAHFAVFCSLGGRMRRAGLSVGALLDLRRLRREVDRTLELAPDFADALAGKGALLLDTPRLLGGDPAEAERLLRRALAVDPDYLGPRLDLLRALRDRGAHQEATSEARRALEIARRKQDGEAGAQAEAALKELGASP
jgi:tetratricopeptide (TPR) repeat protein